MHRSPLPQTGGGLGRGKPAHSGTKSSLPSPTSILPHAGGGGFSSARASALQLLRLQAEDAAEAGDEQAFEVAEAVEAEVAEAGIHLGLRMRLEIQRLVA